MVSISSTSEVRKRANEFFENHLKSDDINIDDIKAIENFLNEEYNLIPEKERIGKGMVYLTKIVSKEFYKTFLENKKPEEIRGIIHDFERTGDMLRFAIHLAAHVATKDLNAILPDVERWANHDDWEIRENACYPIRFALKKKKEDTLNLLRSWAVSDNDNIRRAAAESLRPLSDINWLRDPEKNDIVLEILSFMNHDESIYVRKAVGNNLKDLTKYMPAKVLMVLEDWLKQKEKLDERERKSLLWTIYQALRWLKDKNPEYHEWMERLVGKNYLLYFDEKRNRWAEPREK
ncbi:MAG: DNA alkylation repair protein [Candidatus Hodarchaeota archaeon]